MMSRNFVAPLLAATLLLPVADRASAQDSRAEAIREQQAARQQVLQPPRPNRAELLIDRLEDWGLFTGEPVRGLYPWLGSVFPGGGIGAGAGVRQPVGDDGSVNLFGGYSASGFWRAEAGIALSSFAQNRARLTLSGRYVDAPQVRFHGIGNDTGKDDRASFGYAPATGGARLDVDAGRGVAVHAGVTYLHVDTSASRIAPSIEARFTPEEAPGLGVGPIGYVNSTLGAVVDRRRPAGYSGSGGFYRVQFDDYRAHDDDAYSFRSLEAEVRQLIPLLRANWVLALRGLTTVTDVDAGHEVPYFLLPSLGGSTVRGYPDFRFRDRHRLVMGAELRWTPARFLDMALFYDTGKVAARRQDLDVAGLRDSYGIGMRLVGPNGYALRVEVAHSREHSARLLVGGGGTF
jgi:hypothetical protein